MSLRDRIHNDFTYHPPSDDAIEDMRQIRNHTREIALVMDMLVPPGRELSIALTKLEEAVMWANAGIARNQKP